MRCIFVICYIIGQLWCLEKAHLSTINTAKCARNSIFAQQTCFSITKSIEGKKGFFKLFFRDFLAETRFFQQPLTASTTWETEICFIRMFNLQNASLVGRIQCNIEKRNSCPNFDFHLRFFHFVLKIVFSIEKDV